MKTHIIIVLVGLFLLPGNYSYGFDEYPFEPELVELEGVFEREKHFGPPNYGETPQEDILLTVYVLNLNSPITAGTADTLSELNTVPVTNVKKVQVGFIDREATEKRIEKIDNLIGKTVRLRGSLSTGITGYHFYRILFFVSEKELLSRVIVQIWCAAS